jgi:hypothetical protein
MGTGRGRGLAAPFFADGAVAGSLTFTIPRFRADEVDVPKLTTPRLSVEDVP